MERSPLPFLTALALITLAACTSSSAKDDKKGPQGPLAVGTVVLAAQPLDQVILSTGTLLPNEAVNVLSEVSGRVTTIGFEEGGAVSAGQVLVRINDDDLQAQLRKAELSVQLAQQDEERKKQLLNVSGVSQEVYDQARIQLESLKADADNLRALIAKTTIKAPFSGRIGLRQISVGGYVSPNTLIASLQQTDPIKVEFTVPERYGRQLHPGSGITFTVDGDTSTYTGDVFAMEPAVDASSRSIRVRARTTNKGGRLNPGAFAHVSVKLDRVNDALMVPTEAVIPDIQGQKVLLIKGGKVKGARVTLGTRQENTVQLTSGVAVGDTVITTGLLAARDGMPVRSGAIQALGEQADSTSSEDEQ
ncbi:MAG TPA: efflux RND transporter periplasmic adaptor subunit [Flavobacteriales bacterium]|nr:efflux RND transporter periplasmic adaptor subunit [Flavobacteriales bacterium]